MIRFVPAAAEPRMLQRYEALFNLCFAKSVKFSPSSLWWLYGDNPEGQVVGFDAFAGDELVAHYACIPTSVKVEGRVVRSLLSLNTATHPEYRGKGLFTQLAEKTYQVAGEVGFHSVYGIANANSTPGFVRKLGFNLIQPLDAMIGIGPLHIDLDDVYDDVQFERIWTKETIKWRCRNPANPVNSWMLQGRWGFSANAFGSLISVYSEVARGSDFTVTQGSKPRSPFRLYLGLVPQGACKFLTYARIPGRLRPSPLNFIYKPIAEGCTVVEPGHVSFSFLDFDAY